SVNYLNDMYLPLVRDLPRGPLHQPPTARRPVSLPRVESTDQPEILGIDLEHRHTVEIAGGGIEQLHAVEARVRAPQPEPRPGLQVFGKLALDLDPVHFLTAFVQDGQHVLLERSGADRDRESRQEDRRTRPAETHASRLQRRQ